MNFFSSKLSLKVPEDNDERKTIEMLVKSRGYVFSEHKVTTKDGYILTIFRVNTKDQENNTLPPIIFQHGLFDSADCWLCASKEKSLPIILCEKGFDIWLLNSRGNKYCKKHTKFDNKSYEFWQYSFYEMGKYDIPACIEYIKSINTSKSKFIYFGHSQGTTLMFSALTENLEYLKNNIKLFVALAPVCRLSETKSNLIKFLKAISLHSFFKSVEILEICPFEENDRKKFFSFVQDHFQNAGLNLISETDTKASNDDKAVNVYMKHFPSGTSLKTLMHFIHIMKAKKFVRYDYKEEANFAIYGQKTPTEFDLKVIKDFPVMLIAGKEDKLGDPEDVNWLKNELGANVVYYKSEENMGHISFLVGKSIGWFEEPLKIIMEKYKNN